MGESWVCYGSKIWHVFYLYGWCPVCNIVLDCFIINTACNTILNFIMLQWSVTTLTHWGRVTHICVDKLTNIDSDNGLWPERRQAIIWTNVGILLIGPLGTNVSEFLIGIHTFTLKKMHLKMLSAKWRPFCLSLNVLSPRYKYNAC